MIRPLRIATWNVNGVRARADQLAELIRQSAPDVLCLQEIKCTLDQLSDSLGPLALSSYWSLWHPGPKGYSGVGLHLRRDAFPAAPQFTHPACDVEGRIVQTQIGAVVFSSVYVPNGGKDYDAKLRFMRSLAEHVASVHQQGLSIVLCGDINVTRADVDVHPSQRKAGMIGQRPEERELFQALLDQGLTDVVRELCPDDQRLFTWWPYWRQARERNLGWRLDYVLVSSKLASSARDVVIRRDFGSSDHGPVMLTLDADVST